MRRRHLRTVLRIETEVYPRPWTMNLFVSELAMRTSRSYYVAKVGPTVVGYSGLMLVGEDAHVTTIAVDPAWHRYQIGTRLLLNIAGTRATRREASHVGSARLERAGAEDVPHVRFPSRGNPQGLLRRDQRGRARDVGRRHRPSGLRSNGCCGSSRAFEVRRPSTAFAREPRRDLVLGIETSCDETAAAVVAGGTTVLSSVVSSQIDLHARFGGVVPELAGRAHLVTLGPVIDDALEQAGVDGRDLRCRRRHDRARPDRRAARRRVHAKALALAWDVPFVGVNHLEGHLYACLLERPDLPLPAIVLLVSGGHTMLVHVEGTGDYSILGGTIDDAAGEAYDKVARVLGLGYPGGPVIDKLAQRRQSEGRADAPARCATTATTSRSQRHQDRRCAQVSRPTPTLSDRRRRRRFPEGGGRQPGGEGDESGDRHRRQALCLAGGVAANSAAAGPTEQAADELGVECLLPAIKYCTDNAAMIAAAGWWRLQSDVARSRTAIIGWRVVKSSSPCRLWT